MYYTYVLACENNLGKKKLYVGYCENLINRVNEYIKKDIKTTKIFDKISLVYYEACLNKTDAIKREK